MTNRDSVTVLAFVAETMKRLHDPAYMASRPTLTVHLETEEGTVELTFRKLGPSEEQKK